MNKKLENKQLKILFFTLYAILILGSIWSDIDLLLFIILFVVAPIGIYLFVLKIFPKKENIQ